MLNRRVRRPALTGITIVSTAMLAALVGTGALVGPAAPASGASCPFYSLKDSGQSEGAGGYYLTDEGHNQPVETTGTGSCWAFFPDPGNKSYFWIEDFTTGFCLNVASYLVYADKCISNDPYEDWFQKIEPNGSKVYQNAFYRLNLTAFGLLNGSGVEVAGGPASPENVWWQTLQ
jgi:hypothetical protein